MLNYIVLLISIALIYSSSLWTVQSLVNYANTHMEVISPNKTDYYLIDPDDYLSDNGRANLFGLMKTIKEKENVNIVFIIIKETNVASEYFTEQFMIRFFKDNDLPNHVAIYFEMERRNMRIMTGRNARRKYTDLWCDKALVGIIDNMRKHFYEGFVQLLTFFINKELISSKSFFDMNYAILISIVCVAIVLIISLSVVIILFMGSKDKQLKKVRSFLQSIKQSEMKLNNISSHCILCLDAFPSDNSPSSPNDITINLLDSNITTLECGHRFHNKCISKWRKKQNICPICIKDFKYMNANSDIAKQIVNIHRIMNPFFFSYEYNNITSSIQMKPETNYLKECTEDSGGSSHGHSGGGRSHHHSGGHHGGGHWRGHGGGGRRW